MDTLVEMKNIRKEFPGVVALDDVSFDLRPGEVHLLLGENGAGKSTLMKILGGIYTPTNGTIRIGGEEFTELTPKLSAQKGISVIYQELNVVNELSIAENFFIGKIPTKKYFGFLKLVDKKSYSAKAEEMCRKIGLTKPVTTLVSKLSISEKQMVEIAKALVEDSKVVVMDEPTSSLNGAEANRLFGIIKTLKAEGIGIIYISHKLQELKEIGDRVTVLKDGRTVATKSMDEVNSEDEIISMMVGRDIQRKFFGSKPVNYSDDSIFFKAEHITRKDGRARDVSFDLHRGEVLGFAGLVGAGRTEVMTTIFTGESYAGGDIYLDGEKLKIGDAYSSIQQKIAMVTENRRESGIFPNFDITENLVLVNRLSHSRLHGFLGMIKRKSDLRIANEQKDKLAIKCAKLGQIITNLSGGNQQKVIVGKWMAANASVIIFDEPTKGIDVGTKEQMYGIMRNLAENGTGVIMISSEMPELFGICDRIVVMNDGIVKGILNIDEASEEKILQTATN